MKTFDAGELKHWCQARGIDLCILFGSQATGKVRANSDVDIALFSATDSTLKDRLLRLYGELEDLFGYEVDLVIIDRDTDPVLRLEIFQHGKPLYESQPGLFTDQRILAVKIFDDTEPLRRVRRRILTQRILNLKYIDKKKICRDSFLRAGELKILPDDLAQRLSKAAGMRNVLAHKMNLIQTETSEPPPDEK